MCLYENYACLYQTIVKSDAGKHIFPVTAFSFINYLYLCIVNIN